MHLILFFPLKFNFYDNQKEHNCVFYICTPVTLARCLKQYGDSFYLVELAYVPQFHRYIKNLHRNHIKTTICQLILMLKQLVQEGPRYERDNNHQSFIASSYLTCWVPFVEDNKMFTPLSPLFMCLQT